MRKVILSSVGIPEKGEEFFWKFINIPPSDLKVAFVSNASDGYQSRDEWAYTAKKYFKSLKANVDEIDLRDYFGKKDNLFQKLASYDLIWVGPGDVFPLRSKMKLSGFDQLLDKLPENIVYGGESAGAIVAGKTLAHFIDKKSPDLIEEGLGLVDFLPLPHWEQPEQEEDFKGIMKNLEKTREKIVKIRDNQIVFIENHTVTTV